MTKAAQTPILSVVPGRFALNKPETRYQFSEDVARDQLMLLLEYYDIDTGRITDLDLRRDAEQPLDHLLDLIRMGKVEIRRTVQEKVEVVHTLQSGETVIYGELNAKAKLAMDKHSTDARYARKYALMGSLCGMGSAAIELFPPRDLAVVDLLAMLFMNA